MASAVGRTKQKLASVGTYVFCSVRAEKSSPICQWLARISPKRQLIIMGVVSQLF